MVKDFNFNPDVFSDRDLLGFDQYIKTLSGMIRDPNFRTPFCIGIYGKWGTGKTTFMRLLANAISEDGEHPYIIPVWFNPWRYQKEGHLIIPMLKAIERAIEDHGETNTEIADTARERLGHVANRISAVAAALAYGTNIHQELIKEEIKKGADREGELDQREQGKSTDELSSVYYDAIGQLQKYADESIFRLVVFIDDLDRCLPEKAVESLEAIKHFLDLEGYLFVIGMDKDVLEKGIALHYRRLDGADDDRAGSSAFKTEDYLDKMIQFPLELPPVEAGYKACYIESLLPENEEYKDYAGLIEAGIEDNPRTLKRFVNLLAFISRHANTVKEKIESDEQASPRQKTLVEEFLVPVLYIKWAMIVFRFPEAHRAIKGNRHALIEMQDIATGKVKEREAAKSVPEALKKILKQGKQFPDDDWFLSTFVHLARATTIMVADRKMGDKYAMELKNRPGDMALIHKGAFLCGDEKREEEIDYDYYMDIFPVTNGQYREFLNDPDYEEHRAPYVKDDWADPYNWHEYTRTHPDDKEDYPVVLVSYEDAAAFCRWRTRHEGLRDDEGYRLPAEKEWEKAARGNDGWAYPWGDEFDKERCNTKESGIEETTEVTKYPEGTSPFGCLDMAGNVWEWTDGWYDEERDAKALRGGSWSADRIDTRCAYRHRGNPVDRFISIGFRCVRTRI